MPTKIDLYTKSVLTVIAACLVALTLRDLRNPPHVAAQQQLDSLRVVITGFDSATLGRGVPVNITGLGDNAVLPVTLAGGGRDGRVAVPVNVVQVSDHSLTNAGLPVAPTGIVPINVAQVAGETVMKGAFPIAPPARSK
jgi:hypothetical protein